jgi:CheY-like chemotaxis protein
MSRPCFLVVDREYAGSISTRKLVIETAKFNVITAYSSLEAIDTLTTFPAVSGVVLDAGMKDMACSELVRSLKAVNRSVPIIVVSRPNSSQCEGADHHVDGFELSKILALLQKPEPKQAQAIQKREEILGADS